MFSLANMPSTALVLSTCITFDVGAMLAGTVINEVQIITTRLIPQKLLDRIIATLGGLFGNLPNSQMTLIIDELSGISINEIYQASETYLSTRITPSVEQLKVSKSARQNNFSVTIIKSEKLIDELEGIKLVWEFCSTETRRSEFDYELKATSIEVSENKSIQVSFHKRYREKVLSAFLPYVVERSKTMPHENNGVKLHAFGNFTTEYNAGPWGSVVFHHS